MPNYNKVILAGNIVRDPEVRFIPSGMAVSDNAIAINSTFKDKKETTFVEITLWGKQAELVAQYCKKGSPLLIEGRLRQENWETKEGQKVSRLRVVVEKMQFLGGKPNDKPTDNPTDNTPQTDVPPSNGNDDIPF